MGRRPFMAAVVAVLAVCVVGLLPTPALPERVQDLVSLAVGIIVESTPFILLGTVLSVLVTVWLPDRIWQLLLPRNGFLRRIALSVLGILLPVCECGNVPLARGLVRRGIAPHEAMLFLVAAPIINPVTLLTTWQAFRPDPTILLARAGGGLVIAHLVCWAFSRSTPQQLLVEDHDHEADSCATPDPGGEGRVRHALQLLDHELAHVMPAMLFGAVLAASIQVLVPRSILLSVGRDPVVSILAMVALAAMVALCSTVDAFFALTFASTFTSGSLVAFLTFGPVMDVKMWALLRTTFTRRAVAGIGAIAALVSVLLGLVVTHVA